MAKIKSVEYLYVGTQFLLFLAYIPNIQIYEFDIPTELTFIGLTLIFLGIALALTALYQIRKNLSPFPGPLPEAQLVTTGVFNFIRHPIYSGILLSGLGYSMYTESLYRLIITGLLYLLFYFKSRYEEKLLLQKFPAYLHYIQNTGRFWPSIN